MRMLKDLVKKENFIKEFKYYVITLLIVVFSYINHRFLEYQMGTIYILIATGMLVCCILFIRILDDLHMSAMLKDIRKNNEVQLTNITKLQHSLKIMNREQTDIARLGAKYEKRWETLKWACKDSDNYALVDYMETVEKIVDPAIDEEFDKIEAEIDK